ncbi:MAG: HD-GYP domain-containing protein [Gemmatimonadota bacterium]|nr:HD-GYP domain-containing protein [Gemmatimonadota bacterium]
MATQVDIGQRTERIEGWPHIASMLSRVHEAAFAFGASEALIYSNKRADRLLRFVAGDAAGAGDWTLARIVALLAGDAGVMMRAEASRIGFAAAEVYCDGPKLSLDLRLHREAGWHELHVRDVTERVRGREALHASKQRVGDAQLEMLARLAQAGECRDDDTGQHTVRVGSLAGELATALGVTPRLAAVIGRAAPLHDVGKIGIPDGVLLKPGSLTDDEFALMKTHTTIGARILANGNSELTTVAERIAIAHHERWNGAGYPIGLAGEAIPLEARIVAVADVYDALTHDRPYRAAWPETRVLAELRAQRGAHFDPRVLDAFLDLRAVAAGDRSA